MQQTMTPRSFHLPLRTYTWTLWVILRQAASEGKESASHDGMTQMSPLFRPGSGAVGLQHRSHELASTFSDGRLPEPLSVKANAPDPGHLLEPVSVKASPPNPVLRTDRGTPLVPISSLLAAVTAAFTLLGFAAVGAMMHRHHQGSGHSGHRPLGSAHIPANHIAKIPPTFDPRFEDKYSFRQYMREMQHWVLVTDLPPHQQAVMILRNSDGAAYDLISQIPPNELYAGATVNGVHLDPASNILLKLHHRFAQQDIVVRMKAMGDMLHFRRHEREGIASTLTRFEVIRNRAASEGQFVMTIEGYAVMLMKECRLNKQHIHNLLLPWQGNFPSTEEQL